MKACRTSACKGVPSPSFAWCDECLLAWGEKRKSLAGTLPAPAVVAFEPVPTPVSVLDVAPRGGYRRCTNCTGYYQVLVDEVLCIRCDSILYPSSNIPLPGSEVARRGQLREAS